MAIVPHARRVRAALFNGTDATDVLALYQSVLSEQAQGYTCSVLTNSGGVLTIRVFQPGGALDYDVQFPTGTWMVTEGPNIVGQGQDQAYMDRTYLSYNAAMAALTATPSFQSAIAASASGFGCIPSITVNGLSNANFDIPIRPMVPSTQSFTATPFLTGSSSLLGSLAITGLTSGTVPTANKLTTVVNGITYYDRVRVNVANSGALQLSGAALLCHVSP